MTESHGHGQRAPSSCTACRRSTTPTPPRADIAERFGVTENGSHRRRVRVQTVKVFDGPSMHTIKAVMYATLSNSERLVNNMPYQKGEGKSVVIALSGNALGNTPQSARARKATATSSMVERA
ncbi:MAG: hypothetical protein ACLSVD_01910 [Eggerthellaceae bacterium]